MSTTFQLALTGVTLGLAYSAAPGVVNTEATRRGSARGFGAAFAVEYWRADRRPAAGCAGAGGRLADGALLADSGDAFAGRRTLPAADGPWLALHDALYRRRVTAGPVSGHSDFATGVVFGLANPVGLAFRGRAAAWWRAARPGWGSYSLVAFFLGALLWSAGFGSLVGWGRRWARPLVFQLLDAVCGLALGYFGFSLLWTGAQEISRRVAWLRVGAAARYMPSE